MAERVLFSGQLRTQRVRVWLEMSGSGIVMRSHDIGPDLERFFGKDEIETFLEIDNARLEAVSSALQADHTDTDARSAIELPAARYQGDSAATSNLRTWLDERGIPYRFTIA